MPARANNGSSVTAEAVEAKLPRTFFVMRGQVAAAFGLTREEMRVLVDNKTFVAKYPIAGGRARFIRSQVIAVAKRWEAC